MGLMMLYVGLAVGHKVGRRVRWSSNGDRMGNMVKIAIGCACGLRYAVFAKTVYPWDSIVHSTPSIASIFVGHTKPPRTDITFSDLNKNLTYFPNMFITLRRIIFAL
jgi:hypothetical protein